MRSKREGAAGRQVDLRLIQNTLSVHMNLHDNRFLRAVAQKADSAPEFAAVIKPIESETVQQLMAASEEDNPFENSTNQVETHLTRAAASLNNCVELRKVAHEIEAEAIKAVWNDVVVEIRTDTEKRFDEEYYSHRPLTTSEQYVQAAQGKRTPESTFAAMKAALVDRRALALAYEQALEDRRSAPGSAFNYIKRHGAIRQVFTFLLVESYYRIRAAAKGLKTIYEIDNPAPKLSDAGDKNFLDLMLEWVLSSSQQLESLLSTETEFNMSFWLRKIKPIGMNWADDKLTATSGIFTLAESLFSGVKNIRLRSLQVEVKLRDVVDTHPHGGPAAYPLSLRLPKLDVTFRTLAPVINLSIQSSFTGEFRANKMFNATPIGQWTLEFLSGGKADTGTSFKEISDIGIRMRVAAIPVA